MEQIRAEGLVLGYGRKEVVKGVNLIIRKGEFLSIIGPSGVGKSTLLMGINATTSILGGSLKVLGKDVGSICHHDLKALRARLGVIFQGYNLVARLSVLDNIASGMLHRKPLLSAIFKHYTHQQYEELYEYMKVVGIEGEALSRCDRLSGGQKQRIILARALYRNPKLLFLDEATSHLDVMKERLVNDAVKALNLTKVIVAHRPETIASADRVLVMQAGRIVQELHPQLQQTPTAQPQPTTAAAL